LSASPAERSLYARRARAQAELGRWGHAAADYERALDPGPPEREADGERLNRYRLALTQLKASDRSGYQRTCAGLMSRYGPRSNNRALDIATWTCALGSNEPVILEKALTLNERLIAKDRENPSLKGTRGALLFRAGRLKEAAEELEAAIRLLGNDGEVVDRLFLAMVYARQGRGDEALRWLEKAIRQIEAERAREVSGERETRQTWEDQAEREILKRQAEVLAAFRP
jgi:tetratricopeptide (TPR) repeat protein